MSYFVATQDACISTDCPKYMQCGMAFRSGDSHNYYSMSCYNEWVDTKGNHGSKDWYYCGEKGDWRMFLEKKEDNVPISEKAFCAPFEIAEPCDGCTNDGSYSCSECEKDVKMVSEKQMRRRMALINKKAWRKARWKRLLARYATRSGLVLCKDGVYRTTELE